MANRIMLNETSYHGAGAIKEIATEAKARAFKKAFVCSDPDLIKFGVTKKVTDILDENGLAYEIYSDIKANPTIENVQHGVEAFKKAEADYIVAIGGGSSMDTSKAIGIIIANPEFEDVRSLEGVAPTTKPCVPIIAVPTTAGTAAEVTINYVITDVERKRKFVCVDPHDMPVIAVVDPDMILHLPLHIQFPEYSSFFGEQYHFRLYCLLRLRPGTFIAGKLHRNFYNRKSLERVIQFILPCQLLFHITYQPRNGIVNRIKRSSKIVMIP